MFSNSNIKKMACYNQNFLSVPSSQEWDTTSVQQYSREKNGMVLRSNYSLGRSMSS